MHIINPGKVPNAQKYRHPPETAPPSGSQGDTLIIDRYIRIAGHIRGKAIPLQRVNDLDDPNHTESSLPASQKLQLPVKVYFC